MDLRYREELEEALDAAYEALDCLYDARDDLDNASGWGIFDMLGGGLITSFIKRDRMAKANEDMRKANRAMSKLADELGDVDELTDLNLELNGFAAFADLFFDNFFSDIITQNRIADAKARVSATIEEVLDVSDMLKEKLEELD